MSESVSRARERGGELLHDCELRFCYTRKRRAQQPCQTQDGLVVDKARTGRARRVASQSRCRARRTRRRLRERRRSPSRATTSPTGRDRSRPDGQRPRADTRACRARPRDTRSRRVRSIAEGRRWRRHRSSAPRYATVSHTAPRPFRFLSRGTTARWSRARLRIPRVPSRSLRLVSRRSVISDAHCAPENPSGTRSKDPNCHAEGVAAIRVPMVLGTIGSSRSGCTTPRMNRIADEAREP